MSAWFYLIFFLQTSRSYRRRLIKGQRFCPRVNHWPLPLSLPFALCVSLILAKRLDCRVSAFGILFAAKKASIFHQSPFFIFRWKFEGTVGFLLRREKVSDFRDTTTGSFFCRVVNGGGGDKALGGILRWSGSEPQVLVEPRTKGLHQTTFPPIPSSFWTQRHDWPFLNGAVIICRGLYSSKFSLWAYTQMDEWNKSHGSAKCSTGASGQFNTHTVCLSLLFFTNTLVLQCSFLIYLYIKFPSVG